MSKNHFYIYLKTDASNKHFEVGVTPNIIQTLSEKKQQAIMVAEANYSDQAPICKKLIYYEYGFDQQSAQIRCDRIRKLAPSKRAALVERNNPSWRDLSINWLRR